MFSFCSILSPVYFSHCFTLYFQHILSGCEGEHWVGDTDNSEFPLDVFPADEEVGFWSELPVFLPGESHGQRSLVGCSPWGCEESDMTERLHFHFSLSCIGEGNGNPLQCSCLENPRVGGAWWAAIYGVTQSRTRLKRLSSSSSNGVTWCRRPRLLFPSIILSLTGLNARRKGQGMLIQ